MKASRSHSKTGHFHIEASDDGLNCAGETDTPWKATGDYCLYIYGGYIAVYAQGDGLDSNGDIRMSGGTVIIHGPTGRDNGVLDSGDSWGDGIYVDGGLLMRHGQFRHGRITRIVLRQRFKLLTFQQKSAETLVHIESSGGQEIMTFRPSKQYECVIVSSPDFERGVTYRVYFGGTYSGGTETEGVCEDGSYTGGSLDSRLSFSF